MAQADYNETIFYVVRLDAEHRRAEMVSDAGLMPALRTDIGIRRARNFPSAATRRLSRASAHARRESRCR
jgi:hypothetical protein